MHLRRRILDGGLRTLTRVLPSERGMFQLVNALRPWYPADQRRGRFVTADGFELDLDLHTYPDSLMAFGLYELTTARLIKRLLAPGSRFIDGGANIGYFTLLAARCVGSAGRVDAFEPAPANRARLQHHLAINGLADRVTVHPQALADEAGEATLHIYGDADAAKNHGEASLYAAPEREGGGEGRASTHRVETVRLDEVLTGPPVRLVKLDLEGAEPRALTGMAGLVQQASPPAIIVEFNRVVAGHADQSPTAALDRLLTLQPVYRVHRIGARLQYLSDPSEALASVNQCNLLLTAEGA